MRLIDLLSFCHCSSPSSSGLQQPNSMSEPPSSLGDNSTAATFGDDIQHSLPKEGSSSDFPPSEHQHETGSSIQTDASTAGSTPPLSLFTALLSQVPPDMAEELENDPNLANFIKFHKLINEFVPNDSTNSKTMLKQIPKYNWEVLSFAFEYVYKLYTDEINEILAEFDKLDIKRSIWQESAFRMDGERASRKFRSIESWIHDSDVYLNQMRDELTSSVQIIRNTLNKLNHPLLDTASNQESTDIASNDTA